MGKKSRYSVYVPIEKRTPRTIPKQTKRIVKWNGVFYRAVETDDFIYFGNYREGDDNANCIMYRKADMSLASDNYFASNDLFSLMQERPHEITYLSKTARLNLRLMEKENAKAENDVLN